MTRLSHFMAQSMQFKALDMHAPKFITRNSLLLLALLVWGFSSALSVDTPVLVSPANGATGQPVSLTLSWNAVAFADSYRVQVSTDSLFGTISNEASVAHVASTIQSAVVGPLPNDSLHYWRVRARDSTGSFGNWSTRWRFRTIANQPGVPVLVYPATGATNISLTDSARWSADAIATTYRVQVSTSTAFGTSGMAIDTTVPVQWGYSTQALPLRGLANKIKYYWRVKSLRGTDTSAWSSSRNFTTIVGTPAVPTLTTPIDGAISQTISLALAWTAVTDAATYRVQVSTDPAFTSLTVNDSAVSSTSKTVTLLNATTYYWRVNAKNVAGTSAFSTTRSFSTKLATPSVVSPATNATNQPLALNLTWGNVTGAASYRVQVSTSSTFTSYLVNVVTAVDSLPLSGLLNKTKYYWRVNATGAAGDTSLFPGTAWNFTTIVDTPDAPTLLAPANQAKSVAIGPTVFTWNTVTDASSYRIQVSSDSLFQTLVVDDSTLTSASKSAAGLVVSTRYYWRGSAKNVAGTSPYSPVWTFTTRPTVPVIVSPATNSTGQSPEPVLQWGSAPDVASTRVQVSTATTFSPLLVDRTVTTDTMKVGPLVNKTKYYWRVSARNANGDSSAFLSIPWNFTTLVGSPAVPTLSVPTLNAVSQATGTTTFTWIAATDAATYRLQISTDSLFVTSVYDDSALTAATKQVTGLVYSTRYYWHVRSKNAAGLSDFSDRWTFTTLLAPPGVVSPLNGALDQPVAPTLRWSPVPGASQYLVQMAKNTTFKPAITQNITSADSVQPGTLANDSVYYWRVSARNANGDTSIYPGTPWSFRTKFATPVLLLPVNGAGNQVVNPSLSWYAVSNASSYRLQVSDDPGFPGTVFDDATITTTSRQVGPLNGSKTYYWRLSATNVGGTSTSNWSEVWSFTTRIDTPATPSLTSPANNAVDVDFSPTLQWSQTSGAAFYTVQMAFNPQFTNLAYERTPLIATSHQVGPLIPDTVYYWRVRGINQTATATGPFSTVWSFRTRLDTPSVPALISPASRAMAQSISPNLKWNTARAAAWYRVQLSTDSYFPTIIFDTTIVRDTSLQIGPALQNGNRLSNNATYYWRVISGNRLATSSYSMPFNFTTVIATPELTMPVNGAANQTTNGLEFRWSPVVGARLYEFRLATDSALKYLVAIDTLLAATSKTVSGLSVSTRYYWQVTARSDSNGITRSAPWTFSTLVTVPAVPQLTSPLNSAINTPTSLVFQWGSAIGANTYRLQIATDTAFATVVYDYPTLTATSYQVQSLAYNTTYYWRVSAANGNGSSAFSPAWKFTVTVPVPAQPYLAAPVDGAMDISLPVTLAWGQTSGAASFRVRISTAADFSSIAYDTTTSLNSVTVGGIAAGVKHYWQVTAQNGGGSTSSSVWNFTTRVSIPTIPVLISPLEGALNTSPALVLSWSGGSGASAFHLQIARDSLFQLLVLNDSTVTSPSRTISPPLDGLTRYFWRVRAFNIGGSTAFTIPRSFTTIIGTPALTLPVVGSMHIPNTPTLHWTSVRGDPRYRVQLSTDPLFSALALDVTGIIDTFYRTTPLAGFTRYYWRVSARSGDGMSIGDYASTKYFTTILDPVTPLAPLNATLEQPTTMSFLWRKTGYTETYKLEVATDSAFAARVYSDSSLVDTLRTVDNLPGLTPFYWHVRAQNPADSGMYSPTWSFRTTIGTPTLVSPPNGYKKAPVTPTLSWAAVVGAARYRIQLASDSLMTVLILDDSLVGTTSYPAPTLERLKQYYWRVRAKTADGLSIGAYTKTWSFVTVPAPPVATTLVSPADGVTNNTRTPILKWRAALRAETYGLQIAADTAFSSLVVNDSTVADTVYQSAALEGLQKFFWRVRAINAGGSSAFSARWSFTTIIATPVMRSPAQAAPDQPTNVRLVWSAVPRASTYRVQMSSDSLMRSFVVDDSLLVDTVRQVTGLARSTIYYWRVRSRAAAGVSTSPYSAIQSFVTVIDTPGVPALTSPLQAARNVSATPLLSWRPSPRAALYRVQVAADSLFEFVVFQDSTVSDTSRQVPALDYFATYFWRVRASNVGGLSPYSSVRRFQTVLQAPTPVSPTNYATGLPVSITLRWSAVTGAGRYRLVLSADSMLRNPIVDDSVIMTNSRLVSSLLYSSTYFWRIQAKSTDGVSVSPTSSIYRFTTITEKPVAPLLMSPEQAGQADPNGAIFIWAPALRADRYNIQVALDSLFSSFVLNDSTLVDTSFIVSSLTPHTNYWWRVRGYNAAGYGPFSSQWNFLTRIAVPLLLSPLDSASDLNAPVTLRWQATVGATAYHVQVATDSAFTRLTRNDSSSTTPVTDLTIVDAYMKYYWRVRAIDQKGTGSFSHARWFMTQLVAPRAPVQVTPGSGIDRALTAQTFKWQPSRLADKYELQLSLDSPFDSTVYTNATLTDTLCTVTGLRNNTLYFWRVRGSNAKGSGAFSDVWSLRTIVASPMVPELVGPASGARDQSPSVTLVWRSSPNTVHYHLQLATDAPFASTVYEDSALTDTLRKIGPLDYSSIYYWRVRSINSGWVTDWSPVRNFVVMAPPDAYDLFQNYPNPCNPATVIRYDIPRESEVLLLLYDLLGRQVRKIVDRVQKPGRYDQEIEVTNLPSGAYIYRLITRPVPGPDQPETDPISYTKKLMIIR
jgi:large repetitive protein